MKEKIIDQLFTTNKSYAQIALEVGCSVKYVRGLHKDIVDSIRREIKQKPIADQPTIKTYK